MLQHYPTINKKCIQPDPEIGFEVSYNQYLLFFATFKLKSGFPQLRISVDFLEDKVKVLTMFASTESAPALRQPKSLNKFQKPPSNIIADSQNVILTLKDCRKLVISSDSYHGILMAGNMYKCVFCGTEIELNAQCKEAHLTTQKHLKCMEQHPHLEEFSENLFRKLPHNEMYCSICNVIVTAQFLARHVNSDTHKDLLEKAEMKATTYKPY